MQAVQSHPDFLALRDIQTSEKLEDFQDVYLVQELLPLSLYRVIYSDRPMTPRHIHYIVFQ